MIPIYLKNPTNQGLNFKSFQHTMLSICEKHRKEKRAMIFAFIFYDFTNPYLSKVLNDEDYWLALNQISGEYLTVFSLHYKEKTREPEMRYMTSISTTAELSLASHRISNKYFGDEQISFPSILFFQVEGGMVSDCMSVKLEKKKVEDIFNELSKILKNSVNTLEQITPENKGNHSQIFKQVVENLESINSFEIVKNYGKKAISAFTMLKDMLFLIGEN